MKLNKRNVAREWLIFLGLFTIGFSLTPVFFFGETIYTEASSSKLPSSKPIVADMKRHALYDSAKAKGIAPPNYETFSMALNDPDKRKRFYDLALEHNIIQPGYDAFVEEVGLQLSSFRPLQESGRRIRFDEFVAHLQSKQHWFSTWFSVLLLYFVVQIIRSVFWSVRLLKTEKGVTPS
jgi:hypothetical protein